MHYQLKLIKHQLTIYKLCGNFLPLWKDRLSYSRVFPYAHTFRLFSRKVHFQTDLGIVELEIDQAIGHLHLSATNENL